MNLVDQVILYKSCIYKEPVIISKEVNSFSGSIDKEQMISFNKKSVVTSISL